MGSWSGKVGQPREGYRNRHSTAGMWGWLKNRLNIFISEIAHKFTIYFCVHQGVIHSHILRSRKHEGTLSDDISLACNLKVGTTEGRIENGLQILQLAVGPDHQFAGCIEARTFGRLLLVRLVLKPMNSRLPISTG